MNAPNEFDWTAANQRVMAAEFARLRRRVGGEAERAPDEPAEAPTTMPVPAAIDHLAATFGLSDFERDVLAMAAGLEMDAALAALMPRFNFGMALATLEGAHWSALSPLAPLRGWRLIELEGDNIAQARIRIDERVLHYLAGINQLDARLAPLLREHPAPMLIDAGHREEARRLAAQVHAANGHRRVVVLAGDDADGQRDVAAAVAKQFGLLLCVMTQGDIPASASEQHALAMLWQREAVLLPAALLVEVADERGDGARQLERFVRRLAGMVFVAARETAEVDAAFNARFDKPSAESQRSLWLEKLGGTAAPELRAAVDAVASQFRLSAAQVARRAAAVDASHDARLAAEGLWRDCREHARPRLEELAQRIDPAAGWDVLILPEPQLATLRQLAAQARHRIRVYGDWGFQSHGPRGLGISALFFGESGVGKTMACDVLARELGLDLYRIDLACVVSKYIGETEKNLRRVFDAAEDSGAVLLFDEADALFGKRSEVRDSHDRYANIELAYLLQRMETYRGLAVLTTNHRGALDPAFLRRLRFVVQFPFPDEAQRELIWRRVFPAALPRAELDYAKLARLQMAGGHIRNIAINAAFLAAEEGIPLRMAHLARAAHQEAAKQERSLPEAQMRGWD